MKSVRIVAIICALAVGAPNVAEARRSRHGRKDKKKRLSKRKKRKLAKAHFMEGRRHFSLGRFKQALHHFSKAYELVPLPGLLFNIGQCQRMLGNYKKAVFFYKGFLAEVPDASNRKQVEKLITESRQKQKFLESKTAQEREAERKRMAAAARRKAELERKKLELLKLQLKSRKTIVIRPPTGPKTPVHKKWWFWTLIGGGVAAAVATSVALSLTITKTKTVLPYGGAGTIDFR